MKIEKRLREAGVMVRKPKRIGVNVRMPEKLVERLDKVIRKIGTKTNRSEIIIIALDEFLKMWEVKK